MTPFPYSIATTDSIGAAAKMMEEHDIHHLPVTRDGELMGLLSVGNIRGWKAGAAEDGDAGSVDSLCDPDPYVVDISDPLDKVVAQMAERNAHAALVLRRGKLAGILTSMDVCRAFGEYLHKVHPPPESDGAA